MKTKGARKLTYLEFKKAIAAIATRKVRTAKRLATQTEIVCVRLEARVSKKYALVGCEFCLVHARNATKGALRRWSLPLEGPRPKPQKLTMSNSTMTRAPIPECMPSKLYLP